MKRAADSIVIGSGIAGISCARALAQAGGTVIVLDKGRGIGGRMATRRVTLEIGEISFDHGAQVLPAQNAAFATLMRDTGAAAWDQDGGLVGVPGMSQLPRRLAEGLDLRQGIEITALAYRDRRWMLSSPGEAFQAQRLVLTIPAPQALQLLGPTHPLAGALTEVEMRPCLTLMAAFPPGSPRPFSQRSDPDHPLAWIAQDSSKLGRRTAAVTWVAQAGPKFSAQYLENSPEDIAAQMLPLLCDVIGTQPQTALHLRAHRWRYAQTIRPLGAPYLSDRATNLYLGGDWCLGARAEHAFQSGAAIAAAITGPAHAR
ncbi:MAG: FAD-binding protein [Rhodobacteraceae bacterium]|nr:MAG: FAD-binding protein [Paracoccaceae bacterium]